MSQDGFLFPDDENALPFKRQEDFFQPQKAKKKSPSVKKKKTPQPAPTKEPPKSVSPPSYSVTQLARLIKLTLKEYLPGKITLTGEISNCKLHGSGHLYLVIKDENAQISAVMWKSQTQRLKFQPADGMAVVATGSVDLYETQGKVQFYIERLELSGAGAMEAAFRQLADKLRREGLFDETHKKPLPRVPETVAIVTSGTGAAVQDIVRTLNRRFPGVRKLLYPTVVQGEGAAEEIAVAIDAINRRRYELGVDVIIVGRGGGSIEDLWAFNEEVVARAIYASEIPIISGVGHEVDTTIADLVADARAATPTAAAALAVPDRQELLTYLYQMGHRFIQGRQRIMKDADYQLQRLSQRPMFTRPAEMLRTPRQLVDELQARLMNLTGRLLRDAARKLELRQRTLERIEPHRAMRNALRQLSEYEHRLAKSTWTRVQNLGQQTGTLRVRLRSVSPVRQLPRHHQAAAEGDRRLRRATELLLRRHQTHLSSQEKRLANLDPRAVLRRGFSITRLQKNGAIVRQHSQVAIGEILRTELAGNRFLVSETLTRETETSNPETTNEKES